MFSNGRKQASWQAGRLDLLRKKPLIFGKQALLTLLAEPQCESEDLLRRYVRKGIKGEKEISFERVVLPLHGPYWREMPTLIEKLFNATYGQVLIASHFPANYVRTLGLEVARLLHKRRFISTYSKEVGLGNLCDAIDGCVKQYYISGAFRMRPGIIKRAESYVLSESARSRARLVADSASNLVKMVQVRLGAQFDESDGYLITEYFEREAFRVLEQHGAASHARATERLKLCLSNLLYAWSRYHEDLSYEFTSRGEDARLSAEELAYAFTRAVVWLKGMGRTVYHNPHDYSPRSIGFAIMSSRLEKARVFRDAQLIDECDIVDATGTGHYMLRASFNNLNAYNRRLSPYDNLTSLLKEPLAVNMAEVLLGGKTPRERLKDLTDTDTISGYDFKVGISTLLEFLKTHGMGESAVAMRLTALKEAKLATLTVAYVKELVGD